MTDSTTDMLRTMDELLLGARSHSGLLVPELRPLGKAQVEAVVGALEPLARQKGIALTCELPVQFRLLADPDLLAEVMQNLLTNAIKFTPSGGQVQVGALVDGRGFFVRDSGIGISPDAQTGLFSREGRRSTPGTAGERGSGLGLAVCSDIVAAHGGLLEVQSAPGAGSEFRVQLPSPLQESALRGAPRIPLGS
jgi:signal transduction histidine kinase